MRKDPVPIDMRTARLRFNSKNTPASGANAVTNRRSFLSCAGFTLLELMIVISILLILITIAVPQYRQSVRRARESVLRQDLYDMRKLISEYTLDKKKSPQSLEDLLQAGYLKPIPNDPMTGKADWQVEQCDDGTMMSPDEQDTGGICDVHSSSTLMSLEGTAYSSW